MSQFYLFNLGIFLLKLRKCDKWRYWYNVYLLLNEEDGMYVCFIYKMKYSYIFIINILGIDNQSYEYG